MPCLSYASAAPARAILRLNNGTEPWHRMNSTFSHQRSGNRNKHFIKREGSPTAGRSAQSVDEPANAARRWGAHSGAGYPNCPDLCPVTYPQPEIWAGCNDCCHRYRSSNDRCYPEYQGLRTDGSEIIKPPGALSRCQQKFSSYQPLKTGTTEVTEAQRRAKAFLIRTLTKKLLIFSFMKAPGFVGWYSWYYIDSNQFPRNCWPVNMIRVFLSWPSSKAWSNASCSKLQ